MLKRTCCNFKYSVKISLIEKKNNIWVKIGSKKFHLSYTGLLVLQAYAQFSDLRAYAQFSVPATHLTQISAQLAPSLPLYFAQRWRKRKWTIFQWLSLEVTHISSAHIPLARTRHKVPRYKYDGKFSLAVFPRTKNGFGEHLAKVSMPFLYNKIAHGTILCAFERFSKYLPQSLAIWKVN